MNSFSVSLFIKKGSDHGRQLAEHIQQTPRRWRLPIAEEARTIADMRQLS
jgi:hypothetical protein